MISGLHPLRQVFMILFLNQEKQLQQLWFSEVIGHIRVRMFAEDSVVVPVAVVHTRAEFKSLLLSPARTKVREAGLTVFIPQMLHKMLQQDTVMSLVPCHAVMFVEKLKQQQNNGSYKQFLF